MAMVFVFLLLAAQYESWALPFAVLLCTPLVVLGTFIGLVSRNFDNNVYAQIGLVMLIGLAAKNAILIVEFAKLKREQGKSLVEAALEGAKLRLRPILMTSFAFILGCVPLMLASGSGAASRGVMGTAVVFGMGIATPWSVSSLSLSATSSSKVSPSGGGKSRRMLQPLHPSSLRTDRLFSLIWSRPDVIGSQHWRAYKQ
jgi:multidrug efflux pump subunit AcrB